MKCVSLISGSKANCFYVESQDTALLIDAGQSLPKLEASFTELGIDPQKIQGILITHEHEDHVRHLKRIAHHYKLPVYMTEKSYRKSGLSLRDHRVIRPEQDLNFGNIDLHTFEVLHDSAQCLGFVFYAEGKKLFYASDIGSYDDRILAKAEGSHFIGIESNYEPSLLAQCRYPQYLKDRISGGSGHLSNIEASRFIHDIHCEATRHVMFLHISENSNCLNHIYNMIDGDLHPKRPDIKYWITNRHGHRPVIEV